MHSVCFHHVDEDPNSEFDVTPAELQRFVRTALDHGATFVAPSALVDSATNTETATAEGAVCVIFDDGYRSILEYAAPLMSELGVVFGMAATTGLLIDGERPTSMSHSSSDFLTMAALRDWTAAGGELLGHSHSHIALDKLATATIAHELDTELAAYAEHGIPAPDLFAYPFGARDNRARTAVAARYRAAFATGSGAPPSPGSRFDIHRVTFRRRKLLRLLCLDWKTLEDPTDD
ncbi:polysaccharide deacetylase family protein [Streptomyces sp. cmx-4-7]|uniref:polysaccharide deacetylase family protein n=1 Tax=Streptomyces sp. cmx-4-7 TaxID=2790939 RepID=UPI003981815E